MNGDQGFWLVAKYLPARSSFAKQSLFKTHSLFVSCCADFCVEVEVEADGEKNDDSDDGDDPRDDDNSGVDIQLKMALRIYNVERWCYRCQNFLLLYKTDQ